MAQFHSHYPEPGRKQISVLRNNKFDVVYVVIEQKVFSQIFLVS